MEIKNLEGLEGRQKLPETAKANKVCMVKISHVQ